MASTPPWLERELANGGIEQRERTRMRGEEVPRKRLVCKCGFELQLHVSEAEYERHRRSKAHSTALGRPSSSGRGLSTGGGARAALVGRRVMATYLDEYGETQWYPATIVQHRPRPTKYHFVVHYDAGEEILVGLPDDSVRLMEARVSHCKCARCCLAGPEGLKLELVILTQSMDIIEYAIAMDTVEYPIRAVHLCTSSSIAGGIGRPSSSGRGLSGCFSSCLPSGAPSLTSRRPSLFGVSSQVAAVNAEARARAARDMQRVEAAFSEATAAPEGEALATTADEQERQLQQLLHTAKATATAAAETARAVAKAESKAVETMLPAMVKGVTAAAAREQNAESATLALAAEAQGGALRDSSGCNAAVGRDANVGEGGVELLAGRGERNSGEGDGGGLAPFAASVAVRA
eukprot:CAMPEP_0202803306 /NCGR_PEP_ID=MMETSP1388-20130828/103071_1 /ASSEMBLY_ACC=CAM_ASM_000864 /TAXON_ID=37098 /ORGANISM="Isochrysis sp, Strain CCMP1244" /LENGTH=405 /DNA_ID=CAMNT_0049473297 /DNA_START=110 /DNA_END=1329 /DNA_ORIENTATION=+